MGLIVNKMYFTNVNEHTPHIVFVGRFSPLHRGHTHIMQEVIKTKKLPILVLVRNTDWDILDANFRAELVKLWMLSNGIKGTIIIIPDIEGIYYGRGVGYNIEEIKPPKNIAAISATEIRKRISNKDDSWKDLVAKGTVEFLETVLNG